MIRRISYFVTNEPGVAADMQYVWNSFIKQLLFYFVWILFRKLLVKWHQYIKIHCSKYLKEHSAFFPYAIMQHLPNLLTLHYCSTMAPNLQFFSCILLVDRSTGPNKVCGKKYFLSLHIGPNFVIFDFRENMAFFLKVYRITGAGVLKSLQMFIKWRDVSPNIMQTMYVRLSAWFFTFLYPIWKIESFSQT